ncbi:MAG: UDP-3-O-(3-hydroxymyristoyl)glucosamine N-acyltransferase [Deltaproteobacteria bacterium]|nr:UDP-3-O-(3-hydroxymyristoyl)glucosamine N-acyltransferase [Deltaproteobacteria bacterium]
MPLIDISRHIGATLIGDGTVIITGIKGIDEARQGDLTFISNPKYRAKISTTRASAILMAPEADLAESGRNLLFVADPYKSLPSVIGLLYREERPEPSISSEARIDESACIGKDAVIFPGAYVGRKVCIGQRTIIYPGVVIGDEVVIGDDSTIHPNVSVYRRSRIGNGVTLHAGVVVGSDGFGYADPGKSNVKIPQIGIVEIGDDCEIGANTTIDRGSLGTTRIGRGVKIDNLVQIAHNVEIGDNAVIVAQVGIAGSTKIGGGAILGGQVGVAGHITIGAGARIGAKSGVHKNVPPGQTVSGYVSMPHNEWLRSQALIKKLPDFKSDIMILTKKIEKLEKEISSLRKDRK